MRKGGGGRRPEVCAPWAVREGQGACAGLKSGSRCRAGQRGGEGPQDLEPQAAGPRAFPRMTSPCLWCLLHLPPHWLCHNRRSPKPRLSALPPAACLSGKGPVIDPVTQLQPRGNLLPGTCDQDRVSLEFTFYPAPRGLTQQQPLEALNLALMKASFTQLCLQAKLQGIGKTTTTTKTKNATTD